jgi:hypothetical protein
MPRSLHYCGSQRIVSPDNKARRGAKECVTPRKDWGHPARWIKYGQAT